MSGRPCERCGNFDPLPPHMRQSEDYGSFEDEDETERENPNRIAALCSEVQIAYGLLGWLCHDCRKAYFKVVKNHELTIACGEAGLRLEFWKAKVGPESAPEDLEEGLKLLRTLEKIERSINDYANEWLLK